MIMLKYTNITIDVFLEDQKPMKMLKYTNITIDILSEELSEEDRALKEDLEMLVTRLQEQNKDLWAPCKYQLSKCHS